jgi:predicted kinase
MTGQLIYTIGLPGSGKSTWAEAQRSADPNNVRIVNKDDIRATFGCSFERGDEPTVHSISRAAIRGFLKNGHAVIVSDLNLTAKGQRELTDLALDCGTSATSVDFRHVPVELCIERNTARWEAGDRKVPNDVIYDLATRYGLTIS